MSGLTHLALPSRVDDWGFASSIGLGVSQSVVLVKGENVPVGSGGSHAHRLEAALRTALQSLRSENIYGWFTHCGYLVSSERNPL